MPFDKSRELLELFVTESVVERDELDEVETSWVIEAETERGVEFRFELETQVRVEVDTESKGLEVEVVEAIGEGSGIEEAVREGSEIKYLVSEKLILVLLSLQMLLSETGVDFDF